MNAQQEISSTEVAAILGDKSPDRARMLMQSKNGITSWPRKPGSKWLVTTESYVAEYQERMALQNAKASRVRPERNNKSIGANVRLVEKYMKRTRAVLSGVNQ